MKLPKLNQSGIAHILAPLLFIVVFAGIGVYLLTHSKAATVTDSGGAAPTRIWKFTNVGTSSPDSGASSGAGLSVSSGAAQRAAATTPAYPRCGSLKVLFLFGWQEPPTSPVITGFLDAIVNPKKGVEFDNYLTYLRIRNSTTLNIDLSQRTPVIFDFYDIGYRFELPVSAATEDPELTFHLDFFGKIGPTVRCHSEALLRAEVVEEPL